MTAPERFRTATGQDRTVGGSWRAACDVLLAQVVLRRLSSEVAAPPSDLVLPSIEILPAIEPVVRPEVDGRPLIETTSGDAQVLPSGRLQAVSASPSAGLRWSALQRTYLPLKRIIDVVGGSVLLTLSLPLVAILAVVIKLDSPGPVFYRSERVGRAGRPISVLKFRSMYLDSDRHLAELRTSEWHGEEFQTRFKIREDPRRTRVGRVLRRTSLDEVPQFWNVVRGDMSLVGPRPVVDEELSLYRAVAGGLEAYLSVRPGLTGLWQVGGRSDTTYGERIRLDLRYVEDLGLCSDLRILLKTPMAVLRGDGAY